MLKSLILILFISVSYYQVSAQTKEELEIIRLEKQASDAVLKGDTTILLKTFWSPKLIVNNPANIVVTRPQIIDLIKSGKIDYSSFEVFIEKMSIVGNTAIVMGREEVKPKNLTDNAGKIVIRRYTNVWVKENDVWMLVGRQATISSVH